MVLNIIHNGYLINCNTGDSRTLLGSKEQGHSEWESHYFSRDHNTTHPVKVWGIHSSGGYFITPKGAFLGFPIKYQDEDTPYHNLAGTRVYRPASALSQNVGLSHRRTLNLTATLGDLLFKLDPPVMSGEPDVTFVPLNPHSEYILIVCTDGVWDHLRVQSVGADAQNEVVLEQVTRILDGDSDSWLPDSDEETESGHEAQSISPVDSVASYTKRFGKRLAYAARSLVDRENPGAEPGIFWNSMIRYDDATAQLVHLAPTSWNISP